MGVKVTIPPITNPENSSFNNALNGAIEELSNEFDEVVYRNGTQNMQGDLDMGTNRVYNLPIPLTPTEPLRLADVALFNTVEAPEDALLRTQLAAPTGSSLIGVNSPAGAPTTFQRHITRNFLEDIPGVVEGSGGNAVTNANAINAALLAGGVYNQRPGALYRIAGLLLRTSNSGLVYEGSTANRPTLYMPAVNFTKATNVEAGRYAANACGIRVFGGQNDSGIDGLVGTTAVSDTELSGFILQSEVADNRNIVGIYARNAVDFKTSGVEIFGLPLGVGLQMDSVRGNSLVENLYGHDFYSNTVLSALALGTPNVTGLGLGGNEVGGFPCDGISFRGLRFENINTGPDFRLANSGGSSSTQANQADGINGSGFLTRNCRFDDVYIDNTGEGIDWFGRDSQFNNVRIKRGSIYGWKWTHGAQRNIASNVHIEDCGLVGMTFDGGQNQSVSENQVNGLHVKGIDPDAIWAGASRAGVRLASGPNNAINNRVSNAIIDCGLVGEFGWLDTTAGGGGNFGSDVETRNIKVGGNKVFVQNLGGSVRLAGTNAQVTNVAA